MQNALKAAASALFVLIPATALAAPSISVTRTPSSGNVGDAYSVSWNATGAAKVWYRCVWAWNGVQEDISALWLGTSGTVTGKYDDTMVWTTDCVWTATAQDGSTATAKESFSAVKNASVPFPGFAITKISWKAASSTPTTLPTGSKQFTVEGVWAQGGNVIVSSAGCVYLNQAANSDGSWSVTLQTNQYCKLPESGAFQFSVTANKAYYGEAVRYGAVVFPSASQVEMGKIECRTWGSYVETNFYAKRGESVTCTVSAADSKTKLKMNSGYVSWGDVESTKPVEPKTVTEIPTSCQDGVCSATFVSDYAGYSKTRHVWFENSAGKQSYAISYVSADPASKDYADGVEYLKNKYRTSGVPTSSATGTTSWTGTNGTIKVTSVEGAKYSNGKIAAMDGVPFGFGGTSSKRSQIRLFRKGWESDGVSVGADDTGKWSFFSLGTKWYPKVFKTGANDYVVESVSADGKTKSALTVRIEIGAPESAKTDGTQNGADKPSPSSQNVSTETVGGQAPVSQSSGTSKFSPALKAKLDAFAVLLEDNARAKSDAKASREYVSAVRTKLVALKSKYEKARKTASAAAIDYLIKKADDSYVRFLEAESEESSLMKDVKESY